jgi:hypothetical protein
MQVMTQSAVPLCFAVQALLADEIRLSQGLRKNAATLHHHNMATLDVDPARDLFRQCHGLDQQQLQKLNLLELEENLLRACSGLPLALHVIGGTLRENKDNSANDTRKLWKVGQLAFAKGRGQEHGSSCRPAAAGVV